MGQSLSGLWQQFFGNRAKERMGKSHYWIGVAQLANRNQINVQVEKGTDFYNVDNRRNPFPFDTVVILEQVHGEHVGESLAPKHNGDLSFRKLGNMGRGQGMVCGNGLLSVNGFFLVKIGFGQCNASVIDLGPSVVSVHPVVTQVLELSMSYLAS